MSLGEMSLYKNDDHDSIKTKTQNCVLKSLISILPRKRQGTESESKSTANHTHYDNILLKKSLRKCCKKVTLL